MKLLTLLFALLIFAASIAQQEAVTKTSEHYLNEAANSFNKQHYVKALRASKMALGISFSENDEYHLALSYNLIGAIYNEFSQTERAIGFYRKGLVYANKVDNDTLRLWINSNIGNVYYYNNLDINEGIRYYEKALKLAEKTSDSLQITFIRLNIANAFFEIDKMDEGLKFIVPLSKYIDEEKNAESQITYFSLLAKYHSVKANNKEAEFLFLKAIDLAFHYL